MKLVSSLRLRSLALQTRCQAALSTTRPKSISIVAIGNTSTATRPRAFSSFAATDSSQDDEDEDELTGPLWDRYFNLLKNSDVHEDPHQHRALESLERLRLALQNYDPPSKIQTSSASKAAAAAAASAKPSSSSWSWFGRASEATKTTAQSLGLSTTKLPPQGVYMVGSRFCMWLTCASIGKPVPVSSHVVSFACFSQSMGVLDAARLLRK